MQARALFQSGAPARAFALLETAAKAFPKDVQTQFALADLYNDADRDQDAERTIRQVLQIEPGNADALNYLGYLLAERGEQLDEAIRLVRRALDADPGNPSYLDSLGWAHFRRGDVDEAEKYLAPAAGEAAAQFRRAGSSRRRSGAPRPVAGGDRRLDESARRRRQRPGP